ncbi:MAG: terpene cyclase/mutase family protein [Candidatus Heimdallarchaeota archaeon]|nr:terpene cyclase/mutase family protein [Candidatus Heimdallarchaeota archaeon]
MTWLPILLADPSLNLRYLVMKNFLQDEGNSNELEELENLRYEDPLITNLLALQSSEGYWDRGDFVGGHHKTKILATAQALVRLSYFDLPKDYPAIKKGVEYLFSEQKDDGSWPLPAYREKFVEKDGYEIMSLQTSLPLRAIAQCGYASDPRAEKAYEWLLNQRTPDGAWPTGIVKDNFGYVAGYRKIAQSRWGCRSNTTGALICLAHHPKYQNSPVAQRALDLLLGRDTQEQQTLGFEIARTLGFEPATGFITYFARFDLSLMIDLCWRIEATLEDSRVRELVTFIKNLQGPYGLWEYIEKPHASRWITFDILRSLIKIKTDGEWLSDAPKTPFQTYPKTKRRF